MNQKRLRTDIGENNDSNDDDDFDFKHTPAFRKIDRSKSLGKGKKSNTAALGPASEEATTNTERKENIKVANEATDSAAVPVVLPASKVEDANPINKPPTFTSEAVAISSEADVTPAHVAYCPVCQLWNPQSLEKHVSQCMVAFTDSSAAKEEEPCPDALNCVSTEEKHFYRYSHRALAVGRSSGRAEDVVNMHIAQQEVVKTVSSTSEGKSEGTSAGQRPPKLWGDLRDFFRPITSAFVGGDKAQAKPKCKEAPTLPIFGGAKSKKFESGSRSDSSDSSKRSLSSSKRQMPTFKVIPGTPFSVDAFQYGAIKDCSVYFLTHFHSDHYGGLSKSFGYGMIHCTKATGNLVKYKLRVDPKYIHTVEYNTPYMIGNIEVVFYDANHCPGSAIILFKIPRKGADGTMQQHHILHTGDFRAGEPIYQIPLFSLGDTPKIDTIYLDTTYCKPAYTFPSQEAVVAYCVSLCTAIVKKKPKTLFVFGTYTIGKEKVFMAVARALNCKVHVSKEKRKILELIEDFELLSRLHDDPLKARVHVMPMFSLNQKHLSPLLRRCERAFDNIIAIRPTGWAYKQTSSGSADSALRAIESKVISDRITSYGVPYSEHSSFSELREFIIRTNPAHIISTVGSYPERQGLKSYFEEWKGIAKKASLQPG
eukprot:Nk52_evm18s238 gene=Nk52_evmTU18s238